MASHATGDGGIPPRDASERGLTRIMTLGGAYGTRNYTVSGLRAAKGKRGEGDQESTQGHNKYRAHARWDTVPEPSTTRLRIVHLYACHK